MVAYYAERLGVSTDWLLFGGDLAETDWIDQIAQGAAQVTLSVSSVLLSEQSFIVRGRKASEGLHIEATATMWKEYVRVLDNDWSKAYEIPDDKWEEIYAGAFKNDNYDEVILTPRSGDLGRDVIAVKYGVGAVRILGSFKAYKPGHLIPRAHVHEMIGVVSADPRATKGIISTTSDFAPRLMRDNADIRAVVPYKLELMNGVRLLKWLRTIRAKMT
jgi:restriction system protein